MGLFEINWDTDRRQLRTFGAAGLVVFGVLGALCGWRHSLLGFHLGPGAAHAVAWGLGVLAALCGALAIVSPRGLYPLYVGMSILAAPVGYVVSHVILGIVFYGVVTPVGLIFRILGRDPLSRKLERERESYWVERGEPAEIKQYFRQY